MRTTNRIKLSPLAVKALVIAEYTHRGLTVTAATVQTDGSILLEIQNPLEDDWHWADTEYITRLRE